MPDWLAGPIEPLIDAFLSEYGPIFVALLAGIVFMFVKYDKSKNQLLQAKDEEIERLVEERNRYQSMLLGQRLSTSRKRLDLEAEGDR